MKKIWILFGFVVLGMLLVGCVVKENLSGDAKKRPTCRARAATCDATGIRCYPPPREVIPMISCASGQSCQNGACTCIERAATACSSGVRCEDNMPRTAPPSGSCPTGQTCRNGVCA